MNRYCLALLLTCALARAAQFPDTSTDGQVIVNSNNVSAGSSSLRWSFPNTRFTVGPTGNGSRVDVEGTTPAWRLYAGGNPATSFSRLEGFWDSGAQTYFLREIVSGSNAIPFTVGINSGATLTFNTDGSATHSGTLGLSGLTNRLADNGTTLTYNGTPLGASDTTATNISALTQSGTNLTAQMNFALVARGGIFTLSLTNNCFIGTPSGVNNTDFKKAWLTIRQPSTGTCLVQFTNGSFAFPEGIAPVVDTNANAVTYFEFVSSPWTNGLLDGWMSLKSQRIP